MERDKNFAHLSAAIIIAWLSDLASGYIRLGNCIWCYFDQLLSPTIVCFWIFCVWYNFYDIILPSSNFHEIPKNISFPIGF